jgi:N-acetylneuraminic acid mutarotase
MSRIFFMMTGIFALGLCLLLIFSPLVLSFGTPTMKSSRMNEEQHSWTFGSPMPTSRDEIAATLMNGKIYTVGGIAKTGFTDVVEIYNPSSNTWGTNISRVPFPIDHAGLDAYNGKLYLVGGFMRIHEESPAQATNSLFIYDPLNNKWEVGEPMPTARAALTAKFIDGTLYAIGGATGDDKGPVDSNEAYNPKTNTWTKKAPMPIPRHHTTSQVVDGKLYIIGGREADVPSSMDRNYMYDPKLNKWVIREPMPTKRGGTASAYLDGGIYVFGGEKVVGAFDTNERYDIKTNKWTQDIPIPTARFGLEAVEFNGKIYVIGGKGFQDRKSTTDVNEIFSIISSPDGK